MKAGRWLVALSILTLALVIHERRASAAGCWISATSVAFGSYDGVSPSDVTSTGSVHYWCWGKIGTRAVYLSKGAAPTNNPRQMVFGANRLNYNLYLDAARSRIWGDPTPYSYVVDTTENNPDVTLTVYGAIPFGQDVASGTYSDNITVTILF